MPIDVHRHVVTARGDVHAVGSARGQGDGRHGDVARAPVEGESEVGARQRECPFRHKSDEKESGGAGDF